MSQLKMSRFSGIFSTIPEVAPLLSGAICRYTQPLLESCGSSTTYLERVTEFYIPLFVYLEYQISKLADAPAIIGFSAPQGCGKTTLTESLRIAFELSGKSCVSLSLDDFYLTGEDQDRLAVSKASNELLQCRGNAGTHDIALLKETLLNLKTASSVEQVLVPRYDKSMRAGRGDRAPIHAWTEFTGRPDVVLLEGWMLGFSPLLDEAGSIGLGVDIFKKYPSLTEIDLYLRGYEEIHRMINAWVVLAVEDPHWVYKWRLEAEISMRASGRPGMTDDEVSDFVSRYMPAYEAYLPRLYHSGPDRADSNVEALKIYVDSNRTLLRVEQY